MSGPSLAAPHKMRQGLEKALDAGPIALVDIGTSKTVWMVVARDPAMAKDGVGLDLRPTGALKALSAGEAPSAGVRLGAVTDLAAAGAAAAAARDAAERPLREGRADPPTLILKKPALKRMGQRTGQEVRARAAVAALGAGHPRSATVSAEVAVAKGAVSEKDVAAAYAACRAPREEGGRMTLHAGALGWRVDGEGPSADPKGLAGARLSLDLHVLTVAEAAVRTIDSVVRAADATLISVCAAPAAAGFGALTAAERAEGAAAIDLGAGQTAVSIFRGGGLAFADALRVGGARATEDLMSAFDIGWEEAERLKILDGTLIDDGGDARVSGALGGRFARGAQPPKKSDVARTLRRRMTETLELARDRLAQGGFYHLPTRRIALSGGAAVAPGLLELAGDVLGAEVRIARPTPPKGAPAQFGGPGYAALIGLAVSAAPVDPSVAAITAALAEKPKTPAAGPKWLTSGVMKWARESW